MIKKLYLSSVVLILTALSASAGGYDMSVPVEGDSIANDALQFMVLKDIYPITAKLNPVCLDHKVVNTQVIHYPYDVKKKNNKYIKGYWKELWTVEYCGQKQQIPVTFNIRKNSTDYVIEKNLVLQ